MSRSLVRVTGSGSRPSTAAGASFPSAAQTLAAVAKERSPSPGPDEPASWPRTGAPAPLASVRAMDGKKAFLSSSSPIVSAGFILIVNFQQIPWFVSGTTILLRNLVMMVQKPYTKRTPVV